MYVCMYVYIYIYVPTVRRPILSPRVWSSCRNRVNPAVNP